jgi:uncharacterized protein (TIGR02145 family)
MNTKLIQKLFVASFALICSVAANAQQEEPRALYVMKSGAAIFHSNVSDIDSIIFYAPPSTDVTGVTLNKATLTLGVNEEYTLAATVLPINVSDKTVIWTSSNESKAIVDAAGKITAIAAGSATITAKAGNKTATCTVTVIANPITLNKTALELIVGEEQTLTATTNPTGQTVTWTSSDNTKATVGTSGKIYAVAAGTVNIAAKIGERYVNCTVTIYDVSQETGVNIYGTTWATRNVGTTPNTFTSRMSDYGGYYQWNRNEEGWISDWTTSATTWETSNDVCPIGWRVPTYEEYTSLVNAGSVWTTVNGKTGKKYGNGANSLFLPAAGSHSSPSSMLGRAGLYGFYWSSTVNGTSSFPLYFYSPSVSPTGNYSRADGFSVRCVAE